MTGSLLTHIGLTGPMGSSPRSTTPTTIFFRVTNRVINRRRRHERQCGYDVDCLLVSVGLMTLTRNPYEIGMVTGTTLGVVTDAYTYDGYGRSHRITAHR